MKLEISEYKKARNSVEDKRRSLQRNVKGLCREREADKGQLVAVWLLNSFLLASPEAAQKTEHEVKKWEDKFNKLKLRHDKLQQENEVMTFSIPTLNKKLMSVALTCNHSQNVWAVWDEKTMKRTREKYLQKELDRNRSLEEALRDFKQQVKRDNAQTEREIETLRMYSEDLISRISSHFNLVIESPRPSVVEPTPTRKVFLLRSHVEALATAEQVSHTFMNCPVLPGLRSGEK